MALDLTFSEGVAIATLVFTILAVLFVLPVHPSNDDILAVLHRQKDELTAIRRDIEILRKNSNFELDWLDVQPDAIITIGENLKEKMD